MPCAPSTALSADRRSSAARAGGSGKCGRSSADAPWPGASGCLGIDADTEPKPGLVAGVVAAARARDYDIVSFSPRFAAMTAAEQWVQPAILTTLVYRTGRPAWVAYGRIGCSRTDNASSRGRRCSRRAGDTGRRGASFSDDVTLARDYASRGVARRLSRRVEAVRRSRLRIARPDVARVGALDRPAGLHHARPSGWSDGLLLVLAQALPLPLLIALAAGLIRGAPNVDRRTRGRECRVRARSRADARGARRVLRAPGRHVLAVTAGGRPRRVPRGTLDAAPPPCLARPSLLIGSDPN